MRRRAFLRSLGAATVAAGWAPHLWTPARANGLATTSLRIANGTGTTLESTLMRAGLGYVHLAEAPGWPIVVRPALAEPKPRRDDRRVPLATIVQLTDVHLIDAQSPARVEFLDRVGGPLIGAFRPHETLTVQVGISMIERIRQVGRGPVTGRAYDCAVSTGDNIDNQQHNELDWFFGVLDGGSIRPDSGTLGTYEGVQDSVAPDLHYWHPAPGIVDRYKALSGFPDAPGLLQAAIRAVDSPGLPVRWYSTYGNHDGLLQGNAPGWIAPGLRAFDAIATGPIKPIGLAAGVTPDDIPPLFAQPALLAALLTGLGAPVRTVGADSARRAVAPMQWVARHLAPSSGPGPDGHGFTDDHLDTAALYYTFPVAPGVLGIALDTVNHGGYADGSLSAEQLQWLEQRLIEAHSRYFDTAGNPVRTNHADQLVVLFSHHNTDTMENAIPDPGDPTTPRVLIGELLAVLRRFPNMVLWINGHTHVNHIKAVPDPSGRTGGFWEINTAAHVDYPEHARIVELVDNRDGTLSVFTTILDSAAPAQPGDYTTDSSSDRVAALASWSRELAANDPQSNYAGLLGVATDLNTELLIAAPFAVTPIDSTTTSTIATSGSGDGGTARTGSDLGIPLAVGGALVAGALALRRRVVGVTALAEPPEQDEALGTSQGRSR